MKWDIPARWERVVFEAIIGICIIGSAWPGMFLLSVFGCVIFILSTYDDLPENEFVELH